MSLDVTLFIDGHDLDTDSINTYCVRCGAGNGTGDPRLMACLNPRELYTANITHNLNTMAMAAGLYEALWRPEELPFYQERLLLDGNVAPIRASDLIELIRNGLARLKANPAFYETFNASNGWGLYKHFVPFVEKYLAACEQWPNALVSVCR